MSGKKESPAARLDPEEIKARLHKAQELKAQGKDRESLIQYLQALEGSLGALQQSLNRLQQLLFQLQQLSRTHYLRLAQDLNQDVEQTQKTYSVSKSTTLH